MTRVAPSIPTSPNSVRGPGSSLPHIQDFQFLQRVSAGVSQPGKIQRVPPPDMHLGRIPVHLFPLRNDTRVGNPHQQRRFINLIEERTRKAGKDNQELLFMIQPSIFGHPDLEAPLRTAHHFHIDVVHAGILKYLPGVAHLLGMEPMNAAVALWRYETAYSGPVTSKEKYESRIAKMAQFFNLNPIDLQEHLKRAEFPSEHDEDYKQKALQLIELVNELTPLFLQFQLKNFPDVTQVALWTSEFSPDDLLMSSSSSLKYSREELDVIFEVLGFQQLDASIYKPNNPVLAFLEGGFREQPENVLKFWVNNIREIRRLQRNHLEASLILVELTNQQKTSEIDRLCQLGFHPDIANELVALRDEQNGILGDRTYAYREAITIIEGERMRSRLEFVLNSFRDILPQYEDHLKGKVASLFLKYLRDTFIVSKLPTPEELIRGPSSINEWEAHP